MSNHNEGEKLVRISEDGEIRIIFEPENKFSPYMLTTLESGWCLGTIDAEFNGLDFNSPEKYIVGIIKVEDEDGSDWQVLKEFGVDGLEDAINLLWENRFNAISNSTTD